VPAWDPAASQETPPPLEPTAPPPPRYAPAQPWQPPAATATAWPPQAETWQASASPWQQQAPAAPAWPQQAAGFPDPSPPRAHIQTAKVQVLPTRGLWRPVLVSVAALLVLAASAVHLTFVPLDVLFTWRTPAPLYVASEPEGAIVKLDGVPLPDVTPTKIPIRRDRADHVIEMARPGFRSARDVVRFDRSVTLSIVISLQREGGIVIAPVSPEPSPAPALPAAAAPVGADGEATGKPGARPE
jgi:hypothetical protein